MYLSVSKRKYIAAGIDIPMPMAVRNAFVFLQDGERNALGETVYKALVRDRLDIYADIPTNTSNTPRCPTPMCTLNIAILLLKAPPSIATNTIILAGFGMNTYIVHQPACGF